MILMIEIPEDDYKRVLEKKFCEDKYTDDSLKSIITRKNIIRAVETGIPFDRFKEIASNRITEAIKELNQEVSNQLTCYQCEYNDIPNAGECYVCFKGIQDYFTPKGENK